MILRSYMPAARYVSSIDPLQSLQHVLDTAFGGVKTSESALRVRLDVHEDEKAYHVTADLPGLSEKDVEVSFDDGVLTLSGQKKVEREDKKDTWHVVERASGSFTRQLALASEVDAAGIEARFDKGVLTVTLPKAPEAQRKPHKIEVKSA